MTRIKICGITNIEDAVAAAEAGADALGFVFAKSPRRVEPMAAWEIVSELGPYITGVGVFVDRPVAEVVDILDLTGCSVAQLHGDEAAQDIELLAPRPVVKVVAVGPEFTRSQVEPYRGARALQLDTYVPGVAGGTGRRFDPEVATGLVVEGWRVIVAGGLNPENVAEVVRTVRPYGVDVSSGVESAPGRKDHVKVRDFVAAVRAAEKG